MNNKLKQLNNKLNNMGNSVNQNELFDIIKKYYNIFGENFNYKIHINTKFLKRKIDDFGEPQDIAQYLKYYSQPSTIVMESQIKDF